MTEETDITPRDIALQLIELSREMIALGATMDYYGGMGEMGIHGRELIGAGQIAASWADAIEKEMGSENSHPRTDD
jgi:hypothetical protein